MGSRVVSVEAKILAPGAEPFGPDLVCLGREWNMGKDRENINKFFDKDGHYMTH